MEPVTPIEVMIEQMHTARRTQALATIENLRPMSILGQQIVLWFAYAMVLFVAFVGFTRPTADFSPYIFLPLLAAVGAIAGNAMVTQRRLEALIVLFKQDIKKS